ncbi:Metallophosphoesterase [Gracilaria domingensis]|nr:Metallophosphoesterase [Gracilaria domingensis]
MGSDSAPVRLGLITDVQYANKPDVHIDYVGKLRSYSKVIPKTTLSVEFINRNNVSALLHLGDIIDGNATLDKTRDDLDEVLKTLGKANAPLLHVLGNHCLDAGRPYLLSKFGIETAYYTKDYGDWRVIVLDTVEVSVHRVDHPQYAEEAKQFLQQNQSLPNAKDWNGGLSSEQKSWLRAILSDTAKQGMKAIVCGHLPIAPEEQYQMHVIWDGQWLTDLFSEYKHVVKAYFAGHYHEGGYLLNNGIHYVTCESILDSESPEGSAAIVELWPDRIVISGHGDMTSRKLLFEC